MDSYHESEKQASVSTVEEIGNSLPAIDAADRQLPGSLEVSPERLRWNPQKSLVEDFPVHDTAA